MPRDGKEPPMADLITMLTWNDVTVPNAKEMFLSAADAPCKHWGFKIEGTTPESFADLAACVDYRLDCLNEVSLCFFVQARIKHE